VVRGAAARPDGTPSAALERRVRAAAALHAAGRVEGLLLTGGPGPAGAPAEAEVMAALLRQAGVPEAALIIEPRARTTRENARRGLTLLRDAGWPGGRLILVSDAWHLPRARLVFTVLARRLGVAARIGGHPARPDRPGWAWRAGWLREAVALPVDAVRVWRA